MITGTNPSVDNVQKTNARTGLLPKNIKIFFEKPFIAASYEVYIRHSTRFSPVMHAIFVLFFLKNREIEMSSTAELLKCW